MHTRVRALLFWLSTLSKQEDVGSSASQFGHPHVFLSVTRYMRTYKAEIIPYNIVCASGRSTDIFPLVRNDVGKYSMLCVSPIHGRSFVLKQREDRWVIGKGNGLSYTSHAYLLTSHFHGDTWGGLSLENAMRDFNIGNEIRELGIKTNNMEYVLGLDYEIYQGGNKHQAALLQYSVECPYRISDFGFMPKKMLHVCVAKWNNTYPEKYLCAAEIIISNLRTLHDNGIMHNAVHPQNYTWRLELLDFEASRSNTYPYDNKEYEAVVPMLIEAEIIQSYEIINYIAWCLNEIPDFHLLEQLYNKFGYDISDMTIIN